MIHAGIDEAGYGPLLGPLVTAITAFRVRKRCDLWEVLGDVVAREPCAADDDRIAVADSKVVLRGGRAGGGLAALETAALAFSAFATGDDAPRTALHFVERHGGGGATHLDSAPWYEGALERLELPLVAPAARVSSITGRLRDAAESARVEPVLIGVRPVVEREFNDRCARLGNKARVLFDANVDLLERLVPRRREGEATRVTCDRHGGRLHYAQLLQAAFPLTPVASKCESKPASRYAIGTGPGAIDVIYAIGAEAIAFEVALASMFAKYVRELYVELINRWFVARVPSLVRTAGYYNDAQRFLGDLERHGALSEDEKIRLVRVR